MITREALVSLARSGRSLAVLMARQMVGDGSGLSRGPCRLGIGAEEPAQLRELAVQCSMLPVGAPPWFVIPSTCPALPPSGRTHADEREMWLVARRGASGLAERRCEPFGGDVQASVLEDGPLRPVVRA